jgi:hypothetical protein
MDASKLGTTVKEAKNKKHYYHHKKKIISLIRLTSTKPGRFLMVSMTI